MRNLRDNVLRNDFTEERKARQYVVCSRKNYTKYLRVRETPLSPAPVCISIEEEEGVTLTWRPGPQGLDELIEVLQRARLGL